MKKILFILLFFGTFCLNAQQKDLTGSLKTQLQKDKFTFVEKKEGSLQVFNCHTREEILLDKRREKQYYAKKLQAKPANTYPDFDLFVLEFKNEAEAAINLEKVNLALKSDLKFCNGKGPLKVVKNGKFLFYFKSRATMFIDYVEKYGSYLEKLY